MSDSKHKHNPKVAAQMKQLERQGAALRRVARINRRGEPVPSPAQGAPELAPLKVAA